MSGTGIVAPCGSFFHSRYKRFHIGDIKNQRFKDIWNSEEYKEVMGHLSSEKFDARKQCATLCLQDKVNEVLNDLMENNVPLQNTDNKQIPMHINFI
jgi:radical SAM protein with 4Fe4S-binding SPASM domain